MIQDSGKHASRFSLLSFETTSNETEDLISSIGYQDVGPRQEYPARVIPKRYSFNDGRQLAEFQLVYITGGTGVFEDNESSRIVTPGTLFLLRPGYWHSYHPNRDTGWTEYYIGFNGPTFRREIERFFGERKGPIELGMSATLVDLFEQALFYSERQCSQTMSILQAVVIHMLALVNYNLTTRDKTDDKLDAAINYVKKIYGRPSLRTDRRPGSCRRKGNELHLAPPHVPQEHRNGARPISPAIADPYVNVPAAQYLIADKERSRRQRFQDLGVFLLRIPGNCRHDTPGVSRSE